MTSKDGLFPETLFEEDDRPAGPRLVVDIDGYEGPIDVLLALAREQKLDLVRISILQLADQYLEWVAEARRANLELAADYLVMAAWLAYLKSRLLLPEPEDAEQPSGEEMAAALAFQLQRLEAMQEAGQRLMARDRLGHAFFARGRPERLRGEERTVYDVTLVDLLRAYADQCRRLDHRTMHIEPLGLYAVEDALRRLEAVLGRMPDWQTLVRFLPTDLQDGLTRRSAMASTFVAALEMVREGKLELRQDGSFGPIFVRSREKAGEPEEEEG